MNNIKLGSNNFFCFEFLLYLYFRLNYKTERKELPKLNKSNSSVINRFSGGRLIYLGSDMCAVCVDDPKKDHDPIADPKEIRDRIHLF